ncbi:hypothetical protein M427DRAFT_291867 [Gonapodya prolifera JEL478]|uniref:Uncharacterized protein n=1 Tax=Gonapodya prolifera (strain JEL478) TaxID=1344416 RepID=A0A139AJ99_GONPJ|nr:hypothetical protein M427DRAFT_291867 [Gonapodya prolifera JEL478]|eukprot:KXS16533.1 hypothetical protein M427DRAFT_291867 [Gonapodya prolifera JEL478]
MPFEYRSFRARTRQQSAVQSHFYGVGNKAVEEAGGRIVGVFSGFIGQSPDEGFILTHWPTLELAVRNGRNVLTNSSEFLLSSDVLGYFEPASSVRPSPPEGEIVNVLDADGRFSRDAFVAGVVAHRIFHVVDDRLDEHRRLSESAWPGFEGNFPCRVFAYLREIGGNYPDTRILLLTFYSSVSVWEDSRMGISSTGLPPQGQADQAVLNARTLQTRQLSEGEKTAKNAFVKRQEMVNWTSVSLTKICLPPANRH